MEQDEQAAQEVMYLKEDVRPLCQRGTDAPGGLTDRGRVESLKQFLYEMSVIDTMKALYNLSKQIAKVVLPEAVQERDG